MKPRIIPTTMGVTTAMTVGRTISFRLARVHRSTHLAYSGSALPSIRPAISRNWRRTSSTTLWAARPTEFMVSAAKMKGRHAPMNRPTSTTGFIREKSSKVTETPTSLTFSI